MRDLMESIRVKPTGRPTTASTGGDRGESPSNTADTTVEHSSESIETHLYPFLQRPVRTPQGIGVLLRVIDGRALVEFPALGVTKRFRAQTIRPLDQAGPKGVNPNGEV